MASKFQTRNRQYAAVLAIALLAGCGGMQSSLGPQGPQAQAIAGIGWIMFAGATLIFLLVMALALYALFRSPQRRKEVRTNTFIIAGGLALPAVALTALLAYGVNAMGNLRAVPPASAAIEVVANQWWWDVHYRDENGRVIATANEIRIPAGTPFLVSLRSRDVIHSFWVPNLAGKMDVIPGRANHVILHADAPGRFRGQCAEFCGAQHARMALYVIAEPAESYRAWLARQRSEAAAPRDAGALRGRELFVAHCVQCHTVRGVGTATQRGPDLTHVGSRKFIGAGTLANNRANLMRFIAHSQEVKPGNAMPSHTWLNDDALQALAGYLASLQ